MHISKIVLENFQAFERGEFDLSPNLNILVGISNVGKSSISRALALVLYNKWDKSWVRHGEKYCRVSIQTSTGVSVIREKGEKVNRYILSLDGKSSQVYESFGTGVPEAIQQALKIYEISIDSTDTLNLNLAGQMDALFLLSQTGSYRAKVLGKLSGATYLDHAIRELNKEKKQLTAEKNIRELELQELQVQIDKLKAIESYAIQIDTFGQNLAAIAAQEARLERIAELFRRVKVLKEAWLRESKKQELLAPINVSTIDKLGQRVDNNKALCSLWNKVVNLKTIFEKQTKLNELLKPIDLSAILSLSEKMFSFKIKKDLAFRLSKNQQELLSKTEELQQVHQQHTKVKEQYKNMLKSNLICPVCDQATEKLA